MKCTRCGGMVLLYRGNCNEPDVYKCSSCGREPEMTTKSETVGGDPKRPEEKECNKCKRSLHMDKFSLNRANADGFDRTCKECLSTIRADRKKKKKEKKIQKDPPVRKRLINKSPKGDPNYTDPIELPAQLIRAVSHSIAKKVCAVIMENFPE
jgi:hypothetical protein